VVKKNKKKGILGIGGRTLRTDAKFQGKSWENRNWEIESKKGEKSAREKKGLPLT